MLPNPGLIIKEGILEYCIDGVTSRVGPGSLVYLAPEAVHTVRNVGANAAQRVLPRRLEEAGFALAFPQLPAALKDLVEGE